MEISASRPAPGRGQVTPLEVTDEELVAKLRSGDHGGFELLMRRHNRRVYRAARVILKRDDEAEMRAHVDPEWRRVAPRW